MFDLSQARSVIFLDDSPSSNPRGSGAQVQCPLAIVRRVVITRTFLIEKIRVPIPCVVDFEGLARKYRGFAAS